MPGIGIYTFEVIISQCIKEFFNLLLELKLSKGSGCYFRLVEERLGLKEGVECCVVETLEVTKRVKN